MTPEEAIEIIEKQIITCEAMIEFNENFDQEEDNTKFLKEKEALLMAVQSIREVQQYREIGTVEECREAVEKQKVKKPIKQKGLCFKKSRSGEEQHEIILICPLCGGMELKMGYPCKCGQVIQWDEYL